MLALQFLLLLVLVSVARADTIYANWQNTAGHTYRIYIGAAPHMYTRRIEAGAASFCKITYLTKGKRYYLSLTAKNSVGESDTSPEKSFVP